VSLSKTRVLAENLVETHKAAVRRLATYTEVWCQRSGEIVVLQLSKQNLIYGPLQIEARIDSDQNISKDLSLWNQQSSSVLRGQMLTLPVQDTILYIEPIHIQSQQARMPQMKKAVIAMGKADYLSRHV
jgi:uncharacterized membrane protein (UPF0182 family)